MTYRQQESSQACYVDPEKCMKLLIPMQ